MVLRRISQETSLSKTCYYHGCFRHVDRLATSLVYEKLNCKNQFSVQAVKKIFMDISCKPHNQKLNVRVSLTISSIHIPSKVRMWWVSPICDGMDGVVWYCCGALLPFFPNPLSPYASVPKRSMWGIYDFLLWSYWKQSLVFFRFVYLEQIMWGHVKSFFSLTILLYNNQM